MNFQALSSDKLRPLHIKWRKVRGLSDAKVPYEVRSPFSGSSSSINRTNEIYAIILPMVLNQNLTEWSIIVWILNSLSFVGLIIINFWIQGCHELIIHRRKHVLDIELHVWRSHTEIRGLAFIHLLFFFRGIRSFLLHFAQKLCLLGGSTTGVLLCFSPKVFKPILKSTGHVLRFGYSFRSLENGAWLPEISITLSIIILCLLETRSILQNRIIVEDLVDILWATLSLKAFFFNVSFVW